MKDKRDVDDQQDKPNPSRPSGGQPPVKPLDGPSPTDPGVPEDPGKKP
jgi:hypothetical protein